MKPIRFALAILFGLAMAPASAQFSIGLTVETAPPELPVYDQPPIPEPGYIWTPGYWAWGPYGYYWVPGTWVQPPAIGLLWTPAWWGWDDGRYFFHPGYWGPHVGFYGGIDYGFGYGGEGYRGGRWEGDHFAYNRTVNNFGGVHVTNVYNQTIIHNTTINHISYNGGSGGVRARPTQADRIAEREQHQQPTQMQAQHVQAAATHQELRASENHGHPAPQARPQPQHPRAAPPPPGVRPAYPQRAPAPQPPHPQLMAPRPVPHTQPPHPQGQRPHPQPHPNREEGRKPEPHRH